MDKRYAQWIYFLMIRVSIRMNSNHRASVGDGLKDRMMVWSSDSLPLRMPLKKSQYLLIQQRCFECATSNHLIMTSSSLIQFLTGDGSNAILANTWSLRSKTLTNQLMLKVPVRPYTHRICTSSKKHWKIVRSISLIGGGSIAENKNLDVLLLRKTLTSALNTIENVFIIDIFHI